MPIQRITSGILADGAIVAADIADGSVTTSKLADANVTTSKLASTLSISGNFLANNVTANTNLIVPAGSAAAPSIFPSGDTNTGIFFPAADTIAFAEGGAEAMRIDSSGNVGIGTASPIAKLHLSTASASAAVLILNSTNNTPYMRFDESGASKFSIGESSIVGGGGTGFYDFYVGASTGQRFFTGAAERMRINSSGQVLINTTTDSATSSVGSKFVSEGRLFQVSTYSTNSQESLSMYSTTASAYRFYVGWGGTVFATSATISAISDIRHKENIRDLDVGLAEIMQLQPRVFDWKEGKGKNTQNDRGFIAQEFEQVFPDLIDEWRESAPEGEEPYKSVRQDLIPVLVKAIQELKAINDAQASRIETLEAKVSALESQ